MLAIFAPRPGSSASLLGPAGAFGASSAPGLRSVTGGLGASAFRPGGSCAGAQPHSVSAATKAGDTGKERAARRATMRESTRVLQKREVKRQKSKVKSQKSEKKARASPIASVEVRQ